MARRAKTITHRRYMVRKNGEWFARVWELGKQIVCFTPAIAHGELFINMDYAALWSRETLGDVVEVEVTWKILP